MKENKKNLLLSLVLTICSISYMVILKIIDVKAIGPKNSSVGLGSINSYFKDLLGSNMTLYKVAEVLGYVALLIVLIYGLVGLIQLIKKKSIFKVDKNLLLLGGFYVVVLALYVLFDKVAINYRPILMDGKLEPSFPSSHTMLAVCVCISSILINKKYITNKSTLKITNILLIILMIGIIACRFISGVHWFTDIVGGLIISTTLLSYFYCIYRSINNRG